MMLKKPCYKKEYVIEPDFKIIQEKREQFSRSLIRGQKGDVLDENFVEGRDFVFKKSNSSFALDDIESIIYGGTSSRFWMLRKHMITMNVKKVKKGQAAFYAWQCLTI